jgi:hypothetical protein
MPLITHPRWASSEPSAQAKREEADGYPDDDIVPVYGIVWLASVGRVILAAFRHETFGTEVTVALLVALFLLLLLLEPLRWLLFSPWHKPHSTPAVDKGIAPVVTLVPRDRASAAAARRPVRT